MSPRAAARRCASTAAGARGANANATVISKSKGARVPLTVPALPTAFEASSNDGSTRAELLATLRMSNPFFVRCIKPNDEKRPGLIDAKLVLKQLKRLWLLRKWVLLLIPFIGLDKAIILPQIG